MVNISSPFFMFKPPLMGMRCVSLMELPKSNLDVVLKLFGAVKPDTLTLLADPTEVLDRCPMEHLIKLGGSKGMRFGHYVRDGKFHDWLQYLDHCIISIDNPKAFKNSNQFNEAIQALWFGRGKVHIRCVVHHMDDLDMTQLLYSYTPNDLDFWVEIQTKNADHIQELREELLTRKFSTVRLSIPSD